jgi:hypothetical protein
MTSADVAQSSVVSEVTLYLALASPPRSCPSPAGPPPGPSPVPPPTRFVFASAILGRQVGGSKNRSGRCPNRVPRFARRDSGPQASIWPGSASPKASRSSLPRCAERRCASPLRPVESDRLPPDFALPPDRSTDSDPEAGPLAHQRPPPGPSSARSRSAASRPGSFAPGPERGPCAAGGRPNFARRAGDLRDLPSIRRRASREPPESPRPNAGRRTPAQLNQVTPPVALSRRFVGQRDGLRPRGLADLLLT